MHVKKREREIHSLRRVQSEFDLNFTYVRHARESFDRCFCQVYSSKHAKFISVRDNILLYFAVEEMFIISVFSFCLSTTMRERKVYYISFPSCSRARFRTRQRRIFTSTISRWIYFVVEVNVRVALLSMALQWNENR